MREKIRTIVAGGWNWTRNRDLVVLVLALVVAASTWIFFALADEVEDGETDAFDKSVLRALRSPNFLTEAFGERRVEESVRDITALGSVTILSLFSAIVCAFLLFTRRFHSCLLLIAAVGGGLGLNYALKNYFDRPRPEYVTPSHYVDSYSFPSGHSLLSAVVYLTLAALVARLVASRRRKIYVIGVGVLLAFLVGFSRVYLGVHYPSDVLAGWTVGLVWAIICWLTARSLQRRGKVEAPGNAP